MTPTVETPSFSPNPCRPKAQSGTLTMRTTLVRKHAYEIERLADRARGDGSLGRLSHAVRRAEQILHDALKSEERFISARESHEDDEALRMGGLDVLA